jgi:hypothetical protein
MPGEGPPSLTAPRTAVQFRPREGTSNQGNVLRKALVMPVAALAIAGIGVTTTAPVFAAPTAASKDSDRSKDRASRNKPASYPIQVKYVNKLQPEEAANSSSEIAAAKVVGQRLQAPSRPPVRVRRQLRHQHRQRLLRRLPVRRGHLARRGWRSSTPATPTRLPSSPRTTWPTGCGSAPGGAPGAVPDRFSRPSAPVIRHRPAASPFSPAVPGCRATPRSPGAPAARIGVSAGPIGGRHGSH